MNSEPLNYRRAYLLLFSIFLISLSALVYELLFSTISTYLEGESVFQFSITIGLFLTGMGIGSFLTKYIEKELLDYFIRIEVIIGAIGGVGGAVLFFGFAYTEYYNLIAFGIALTIGIFIGMELPLLIRIIRKYEILKEALAKVLSFDYIGALFASIIFPLVLLPYLGLIQTGFFLGLINIGVAFFTWLFFKNELVSPKGIFINCITVGFLLILGLTCSNRIISFTENKLFQDEIILTKQSRFQRIVLTRWKNDIRLFINGSLQFSTVDEYRYHEPLTHPAMSIAKEKNRVVVLGGGDGMAVREILRWKEVKEVIVVDIDPVITTLFKTHPLLRKLNSNSFNSKKVKIINKDAQKFLEQPKETFPVIIIDLPDPDTPSIARLYTKEFYRLVYKRLDEAGVMVTQGTSPLFSRKSFSSIAKSIEEAGFYTLPYHHYIPSMGDWGFIIGTKHKLDLTKFEFNFPSSLRYLTKETFLNGLIFPNDSTILDNVEVNTLNNLVILHYYEEDWKEWE